MKKHLIVMALIVTCLTFIGCEKELNQQVKQPKKLQTIDVAEVLVKPVQNWHTYTTRIESPEQVALMPRISGVIEEITFKEGEHVKKGDLLFKLDDRPFIAVVAGLEAQILSAKAVVEQAKNEEKRGVRLVKQNAISTEQAELRISILRQRKAQLAALQAQLKSAQLDLQFTAIRSPIDGIISRANITKGNNIRAGQSVLTSIVSNKTMYAYFDIDERTWNSAFANITVASKQQVILKTVGQSLEQHIGGIDFSYKGYINFIDNQINSATGTLRVRAIFNETNDENYPIRSGSFARIKLAANSIKEEVIVPDRAIGTDLKNRFVLAVDKNNTLQYKRVEVGERYGRLRVITSGLQKGDVIAINGPARVGPGMPITPSTVTIDSTGIAFTLSSSNTSNLIAKK